MSHSTENKSRSTECACATSEQASARHLLVKAKDEVKVSCVEPAVAVNDCNPSTGEAEAGG